MAEKAKNVAPPIEDPAKAAVAAYQANFKFRANNKDHEFPESIRGAIKDADTEKHLRQIYEKAYGLEAVKERYNGIREEHNSLRSSYGNMMGQVQEAQQAYQKGDLDSVFETFKINPEKVLQWAVEKVQLSQLPPEQRQAYEAKRYAEKQNYLMEKKFQETSQQTLQQESQYLSQMLALVLERPDYSAVAQAYDSKKGKPGAFRELVIKVGESESILSKKTLTPLEAAQKAIEWLGEMPGAAQKQATAAPAQVTSAPPATQEPQKKQTLPNLANAGARTGSSPAKKQMRSIDDLKKAYDQMAAQK